MCIRDRALRIYREIEKHVPLDVSDFHTVSIRLSQVSVLTRMLRLNEANDILDVLESSARKTYGAKDNRLTDYIHDDRAELLFEQGKYALAEQGLTRALRSGRHGDRENKWRQARFLASSLYKQGKITQAVEQWEELASEVESVLAGDTDAFLSPVVRDGHSPRLKIAAAFVAQGNHEKAFEEIEKFYSLGLRQALSARHGRSSIVSMRDIQKHLSLIHI